MRRPLLLGVFPVLSLMLLGFAGCGAERPVRLELVMRAPLGLLNSATSAELLVFDAAQGPCPSNGHVDIPAGEGVQQYSLDQRGCTGGAMFCKTIQLDKDGTSKTFAVVAKNAGGIIAEGCSTATIDQDPLEISITVRRYNPPACCNDGVLQTSEQCEAATKAATDACQGIQSDEVCGSDCRSNELLVSVDNKSAPFLKNGPPRSKSHLAMSFGPGSSKYPNALRALFVNDDNGPATGGSDINQRFLSQDLRTITDPPPLALQLNLPIACGSVTTQNALKRAQRSPAIAPLGDMVAVVYASDEFIGGIFDIYLSLQTAAGCVETAPCKDNTNCVTGVCGPDLLCSTAVRLNDPGPAPGASDPDVAAGPPGSVLVTWARGNNVYGRVWKNDGKLIPTDRDILIASNATAARVAGDANGWRVVYQNGPNIFLVPVSSSLDIGKAVQVNIVASGPQDQPDIASIEDGRSIVVWHGNKDVYFQRYDKDGAPMEHDQDAPLNTEREGDQQHPAVAASVSGAEGFFSVAWETTETATIAARFVGGTSGFKYNSVTGQNDQFTANSPATSGERHFPAVAIGGGGYVVIGWQDDSQTHPGIYIRRFPLPEL